MKLWEKVNIKTDEGQLVEAVAPLIISASRSTDIPAFYSQWLSERMKTGYVTWKNPFNQQKQYVSFENARLFVFWSKNPKPLMKYLKEFDKRGINYYFQFTLNDYETENLEPNVPPLVKRIETFKKLSEQIGKDKVIWRYDPLLLSDNISEDILLKKIEDIGNKISGYTSKLVFSYADINIYRKVVNNLKRDNVNYIDFSKERMLSFAEKLSVLNEKWGLELATCCEEIGLYKYGIKHNKCIDDDLIIRLFKSDKVLMDFLGYKEETTQTLFGDKDEPDRPDMKDKGQRKVCGCIMSKDIGEYNTCPHLCTYCYANSSETSVKNNVNRHDKTFESILY